MDDFINNYWLILQMLQKNKKLTKRDKLKSGGDFFRDELHKLYETNDPEKKQFMHYLGDECKKYQQIKKKKLEQEKQIQMEKENSKNAKYKHLDMVNEFGKENAKTLVSLEN